MNTVTVEILIILFLISANGVFALSEMAVVSVRKARLLGMIAAGNTKARRALDLSNSPERFLPTVQIGITLVGILAGAVGGATLAKSLGVTLKQVNGLAPYAESISLGIVTLAITYFSLVLGELTPKRLALRNPEQIAIITAPLLDVLSVLTAPVVRLLSISTEMILRIFGNSSTPEQLVTEEEIKIMIEQGAQTGVFEPTEQDMISRIFRLGDRKVNALITPRTEIVWLDLSDPLDVSLEKVMNSAYSRFPVAVDDLDKVEGFLYAKDLLSQCVSSTGLDLRRLLRPAFFVPENMSAFGVMEEFRRQNTKSVLVIDEYGGVQGLVTLNDILEAIVGDFPEADEEQLPEVIQREDGSWLVDGLMLMDEFCDTFRLSHLPREDEGHYQTLGGFTMKYLERIPRAGDHFEWGGLRFEVVDMDGMRVDKVLVSNSPPVVK